MDGIGNLPYLLLTPHTFLKYYPHTHKNLRLSHLPPSPLAARISKQSKAKQTDPNQTNQNRKSKTKNQKSTPHQPPLRLAPVNPSVGRIGQQVPHLRAYRIPAPARDPVRLLLQGGVGVVVGFAVDVLVEFEGGLCVRVGVSWRWGVLLVFGFGRVF